MNGKNEIPKQFCDLCNRPRLIENQYQYFIKYICKEHNIDIDKETQKFLFDPFNYHKTKYHKT